MIDAQPCGDQFPSILGEKDDLDQLQSFVKSFPEKYRKKFAYWKNQIDLFHKERQRVVLWGSGSKGVSFLTTLKIGEEIEYVVDINPYRQGTFMAGTGHEIVPPSFLKKNKPDKVIVMNAIYREEITETLKQLALFPEILTL
jgi:hypothetical protein